MGNELKSLQQRHTEWINIVNRGDAEAYAELLTENAVWLPSEGGPIVGRVSFKEWLSSFFGHFDYDFSITDARFRISSDRAVSKGKFTSVMTPNDGEKQMQHSGTFIVLWRKVDEHWYIDVTLM